MTLRCAVVCPIASGGGITEAFLTSLDMLRDNGVTPVAIIPDGFFFKARLAERGYETHTIRALERGGAFNLVLQSLAIARAAKQARVDVLVLNNGRHVKFVKRLAPKIPLVAIYHGGKTSRYLNADRIITINDDQLQYLVDAGYPAAQAVIVDNALPLHALPPYAPKPRAGETPVVGTLRLLEPAKGVDILVEAMGLLAQRGRRFKTRIGSSGSQESALRERASTLGIGDLVEFCGWIDDKAAFFDSLDIYVLPSRAEEWGIGIVEANAARLPVVATACLGPKRIVKDEITGLMTPIADPLAMANAIERLADNPDFAERLARAAYLHCEANYLFPRIAPIFVREVLRVLEQK